MTKKRYSTFGHLFSTRCAHCQSEKKCITQKIRIALAGNANVGKSVIFNYLTGLHQHIGNWPGKTVERAEGSLKFKGYTIEIVDLPGIYSLSPYSLEEIVSREYVVNERPDVVINVIDACLLERNLFFTLQLLELEVPMIIALNQIDIAKRKGFQMNIEELANLLGRPVIPTVAIRGVGISQLLEKAIEIFEHDPISKPAQVRYNKYVEDKITDIAEMARDTHLQYPSRYVAIKLIEGDEELERDVSKINPQIISSAKKIVNEFEDLYKQSCSTIITSERYEAACSIVQKTQKLVPAIKPTFAERLHNLTTHRILGYLIMLCLMLSMFFSIFTFGNYTSELLNNLLYRLEPLFTNLLGAGIANELIWGGIMEGLIAGIIIVIPYIVPFYLILYVLEGSGYLSRIAFLMDNFMHGIGLHGKAFIPLILGYGCTVPAVLGCKIMETEKERLLTAFVTTMVPCAARTVVILGLVGKFLGIQWALLLYIFNLLIIFALGRLSHKILPGEQTALIMEMNDFKVPHLKTILRQTWFRLAEFIKIAFPLIIVGNFVVKLVEVSGLLEPITTIFSPVIVFWLGLPAITGIALIFGVLRKELTLIMLATLLGTTNFALVLTPIQMVVFTLVTIFYVPCIATIAALVKEFRWKKALFISALEIVFALLLGGIAFRVLTLII